MRMRMMAVGLALAGMCGWAGLANAQAGGVEVRVPFRFNVGEKTFAAGDYVMLAGPHQVRVASKAEGKTLAMAIANDVSGQFAGANGRIVFRCYGDRCFLAEVWSPAQDNGRHVLPPRAETQSSRERSGTYFAILGTPSK